MDLKVKGYWSISVFKNLYFVKSPLECSLRIGKLLITFKPANRMLFSERIGQTKTIRFGKKVIVVKWD